MRCRIFCLPIMIVALCTVAYAADDAAKPAPAKADDAGTTFNGGLAPRGLTAKDGIVAMMAITSGDKGETVEWVDLYATGDAAKKLDELASQHAKVTVTGTRAADGIHVTKVADDAKIPPQKGKKKKK